MHLNHHRSGSGEPLVLIHGIGHRWQGWLPVIERLVPHRDVIAVDLPGFAGSAMPAAGTPPGIESLTALVGEFLDELGLERPHVAGNSLGGWISLELAKQGRARSTTALSPAGFHNRLEGVYQRTSLALAAKASRLIAAKADRILARPGVRVLAFKQLAAHPERIPFSELVPVVRDLARAPWFDQTLGAINRLPFSGGEQITVPVTIAWGERDRLLLPHQAKRAARAIPSARILSLHGCGHVPTYDDPDQVARVLLEGSRY
jgi:pimeloyl-ACP methyl ester carboxylesterase